MSSTNLSIKDIDSLLEKYLKPASKILKYEMKSLTAPGDNYGSVISAVDVTVQEGNDKPKILHLVAKQLPANELLRKMFNVQETFKKEMGMYLDVIPTLMEFQMEYGVTTNRISDLFAKCYGARINLKPGSDYVDDDAVLVLENLKIDGYDIGDRLIGFNLSHAYRILEDLATLHAVPIAMKILKPNEFDQMIYPVVKGVKICDNFNDNIKQKMVDEMIDVLSDEERIHPHKDQIIKTIRCNLDGSYRCSERNTPFNTIIHSDYWVNNTMILQDENGEPIGNKIVDLQMPAYSTAIFDVLFFLYTSVIPDIFYKNFDTLLLFYHTCFIRNLKAFKIDATSFSWERFNEELKRYAIIELGHILVMYKPVLMERGAIDDMSNWDTSDMLGTHTISSDYKKRMVDTVLSFIDRKWMHDF